MNEDKASRYHRLKRQSAVISVALTTMVLGGVLFSGASRVLADAARSWAHAAPGRFSPAAIAIYVVLLAAVQEATALPLTYYRGFFLEQRYGLSSETLGRWLRDHAKAAALGVLLAAAGAEVVYFLLTELPAWWWLASAAVFAAAMFGIAKLLPLVLLPLFYKFTPLDRDSLRARLVSLSERAGVPVLGIYEWGLGEKTRRANAALVGTGVRAGSSSPTRCSRSTPTTRLRSSWRTSWPTTCTATSSRRSLPSRCCCWRRSPLPRPRSAQRGSGSDCDRRRMWRACLCCCSRAER